ncbi:hypothetical protein [Gracilibacillus saliphilus]|uniref:hypothetical protein n=1 Tax=Gracilibacillus saliphilus TaxID=543890 RepID=UPI001EE2531D|nr:hypothetical protein [Gracilibacillus saliphilus]
MKNLLTIGLFGWLLKLVFAEAVVLGIVWLLNAIFAISISYALVGSVVGVFYIIGLIYSLLVINSGKKMFKDFEKGIDSINEQFDKW